MKSFASLASLLPVLALALPGLASAQIADPANDWWTAVTASGNKPYDGAHSGDMDVLNAFGLYDASLQSFTLVATMNGAIGASANAHYIWGVNTGAGTAGFATSGLNGVLFNKVFNITPGAAGTATVAGATASYVGSTLILVVPLGSLPASANGFTPGDFTWNLWSRDFTAGLAQPIGDFAPDNANMAIATVGAVPEPGSMALMMMGGAGLLAWRRRKAS